MGGMIAGKGTVYMIGGDGTPIELGQLEDIKIEFRNNTSLDDSTFEAAVGIIVGTGLVSTSEAIHMVERFVGVSINSLEEMINRVRELSAECIPKFLEDRYDDYLEPWSRLWDIERNWTLKNRRFYGYTGMVSSVYINCRSLLLVCEVVERLVIIIIVLEVLV